MAKTKSIAKSVLKTANWTAGFISPSFAPPAARLRLSQSGENCSKKNGTIFQLLSTPQSLRYNIQTCDNRLLSFQV